ncbi:hypothetical protein [Donghicola sp. XS_ASV15]|uniref:hypothetical protein n=1 Tax=Donghicola sp. XS_ASV15 TaxID=3241295 RepID=UPI0035117B60
MTALKEYQRLEAVGVWRERPDCPRQDVVVSLGDATIVVMDMQSRALTHWSIPAVARANPGSLPAIYHPDGDPSETLEIDGDEIVMIEAIEKLRLAIDRSRPKQRRLRWGVLTVVAGCVAAASFLWLPDVLRSHAATVVPPVKRAQIGIALINHVTDRTGAECRDSLGSPALSRLGAKLFDDQPHRKLMILPGGPKKAMHLPGGTILLHKSLVEDFEDPSVLAGFALAESLRATRNDPLAEVLEASSLLAVIRLLTTGAVPDEALQDYADQLMSAPQRPIETARLLELFKEKGIATTPYAQGLGPSRAEAQALIAADPFKATLPPQLMSDGDWISIQGICES